MRKIQLLLMSFLFISAISLTVQAQERVVTGRVIDSGTNDPLPGVSVIVKGTTTGSITDATGKYSITVTQSNAILQFSFIGFATKEVTINGQSTVDVSLLTDAQSLSEVVVTGYGNRDKLSFTGSATTLGGDKIEHKPFATVDQALQGNVAGLQMSASSGTPGALQDIRIRGVSSIIGSNAPLFVIDGVPVVSGELERSTSTGTLSVLSSLNSNDIESMTVLKDASATAFYGARGANGVIVITTKKGKVGKPVFSVSAQTGVVSRAIKGPKMLNASQWDELYYESLVNSGDASTIEEAKKNYPSGWDGTTNTDWRDVVSNKDAKTYSLDFSVRGGNDKSNYYTSLGYFAQDGVNTGSNYKRYTGKVSLQNALTNKLTLNNSTNISYVLQNGQLENSAYFGNPDAAYLFLRPMDKPYNEDGSINTNMSANAIFNPLYIAKYNINRRKQTHIFNVASLGYDILNNLKFTTTLGLDYILNEELYFANRNYGDGVRDPDDPTQNGTSEAYSNRNFNWNWKNMLEYGWQINSNHRVDLKAVYESQRNQYYTLGVSGYGIAADGLIYPESISTTDGWTGYTEDWSLNAVSGIIGYKFKNSISLDGTIRGEGSSKFAPGKRWGTFYSIGAAWSFSEETFMQSMKSWLTLAKLRASYGVTGNSNIDPNKYQSLLSYGGVYNGGPAVSPGQVGNTNLTWEKNANVNVGLDVELFGRINATVEYFRRRTYDLLQEVPLSYTTGFTNQTQNVGEMVNKGFEVTVGADILKASAFKWNVNVNLTSVHNKVTKLATSSTGDEIKITSSTRIVQTGHPVYSWYMPTWAGVDPQTGSPLWYKSGTSGETTSTYSQAGYSFHASALPTFYGGITNRFDYKGIYLSANLYYSTGNKIYDSWGSYTQSDGKFTFTIANAYASQYDRWQKPGDLAENPKNVYNNTSLSNSNSTRRLYSGEYFRLRDITLGYNFPTTLISKLKLGSASVYVKGNNLWTWVADKKLQFDPETRADGLLQLTAQPLKTVAVGLNVTF
ncbi:TonB-dependent receptor [Cytophagaceae bacterium DM2B3-1]|uniref:TonB-dependent receptor n=1 Tax=Xanthocytophaga flava TaxID=3048013 RepID=A0ABT7CC90_9BACT|nr:TonB-dependent receptor [Xanthocytophaga flavus]MDJ1470142.1 TonB-dependent receptor [Xanthocytophaga flavus]MDJ1491295.1 TonB-dependent receptor [Xanthocytophaga flavus]